MDVDEVKKAKPEVPRSPGKIDVLKALVVVLPLIMVGQLRAVEKHEPMEEE